MAIWHSDLENINRQLHLKRKQTKVHSIEEQASLIPASYPSQYRNTGGD